jgi:hypothetical protein
VFSARPTLENEPLYDRRARALSVVASAATARETLHLGPGVPEHIVDTGGALRRVGRSLWLPRAGLDLDPGFRVRTFLEFGMPADIADKYVNGGRLLGLPE